MPKTRDSMLSLPISIWYFNQSDGPVSVDHKNDCNCVAILLSCDLVQKRPIILRFIAIVLLLVFSQKLGTGLFIHSLLHTGNTAGKFPLKQSEKNKHLGYACTCIDDFLMPYAEAEEQGDVQPVLNFVIPFTFFKEHIPFRTSIFSSLRGPPAIIV